VTVQFHLFTYTQPNSACSKSTQPNSTCSSPPSPAAFECACAETGTCSQVTHESLIGEPGSGSLPSSLMSMLIPAGKRQQASADTTQPDRLHRAQSSSRISKRRPRRESSGHLNTFKQIAAHSGSLRGAAWQAVLASLNDQPCGVPRDFISASSGHAEYVAADSR